MSYKWTRGHTNMKVSWRRNNFLKAPKFENFWEDRKGRKFMIVNNTERFKWAIFNSSEWGENDILAYVRVGKDENDEPNEMPEEGDKIQAVRGSDNISFTIGHVFRNVGRIKTVPLIVHPA